MLTTHSYFLVIVIDWRHLVAFCDILVALLRKFFNHKKIKYYQNMLTNEKNKKNYIFIEKVKIGHFKNVQK
jgi:hypothetical protein